MTDYITSVGVQHFSITIASGSTTGTATINAVGSGAFILFGGMNPSATTDIQQGFTSITKTNSTTITATRNNGLTGTVVVNGCIIDGDTTNLIKSVQYGTVTIANAASTGTASISAVTNANAATHLLGWSHSLTSASQINDFATLSLSGTTVTATRPGTSGVLVAGFVIIEFQGAALNQAVQNISATSSSSVTSYTAAITSVNVDNALLIYGGSNVAAVTTSWGGSRMNGVLTNGTTITVAVNTATANLKTYNCTVIEFIGGLLNSSVQRGTTTLTGVASNTSTITGVTKNNSLVNWLDNTLSAGDSLNSAMGSAALTNGTTVTVSKNVSTNNIIGSWEVAEFIAAATPKVATWSAAGALVAVGASLAKGVATWSPHASLAAVGSTLGNVATWSPHSSLAAVGRALNSQRATWSAHGSLAATGAALNKQRATWSAAGSFAAVGGELDKQVATWSAHGALAVVGHSLNSQRATFSPSAGLALVSRAVKKSAATFSMATALAATGASFIVWRPSVSRPAPRRQEDFVLQELRQDAAGLNKLRHGDPALKSTRQEVATLGRIRHNEPALKQTRKTQPLLGD